MTGKHEAGAVTAVVEKTIGRSFIIRHDGKIGIICNLLERQSEGIVGERRRSEREERAAN